MAEEKHEHHDAAHPQQPQHPRHEQPREHREKKGFKLDRATMLRAGVILIILLFVLEMFIVLMYQPSSQTVQPQQNQSTQFKTFTGYGSGSANITSFTTDLFAVCNASTQAQADAASKTLGNAFNQAPAIAVSETAGGTMFYLKLANASQITPELTLQLEQQLAPDCNGAATIMRQALVSFNEQIVLISTENVSDTVTLSAYALRMGVKAFVTDAEAVEGDTIPVRAEARIVQGQISQFIAMQAGSSSEIKPIERKSGVVTVNLVKWTNKARATAEVAWANRTTYNVNATNAQLAELAKSNASAVLDTINEIVLLHFEANSTALDAIKNLSFVDAASAADGETHIETKADFADEAQARSQLNEAVWAFSKNFSVYFSPSNLYTSFYWDENASNYDNASKEIDDLFPGANFRRIGLVESTNMSVAEEQLGFKPTPTFEAILYSTEQLNTTLIVYVDALVQGKNVLSFYAEG